MSKIKTLMLCAAILPLAACATTSAVYVGEGANAKNAAAQHVAPTAEQKANTFIPHDPERRRIAREAYREDKVKEPQSLNTK